VQNYKTGALEIANYRISKSAWLQEHEHKHVAAVSRRVEHMTSMSVETAEELQVVNYGIGGHYEPHFDFARVGRARIIICAFLVTSNLIKFVYVCRKKKRMPSKALVLAIGSLRFYTM
jgi:hypothetical protein